MRHEESILDYENGYRVGTFDKCNGRPCLNGIELFARGEVWAAGYEDGYTSNEQRIGPPVRTPLQNLMLEIAAAELCDGEITIMGNGHHACNGITDLLRWLDEEKLLTLPPPPSKKDAIAFAVEVYGVDPDCFGDN